MDQCPFRPHAAAHLKMPRANWLKLIPLVVRVPTQQAQSYKFILSSDRSLCVLWLIPWNFGGKLRFYLQVTETTFCSAWCFFQKLLQRKKEPDGMCWAQSGSTSAFGHRPDMLIVHPHIHLPTKQIFWDALTVFAPWIAVHWKSLCF